MLVYTIYARLEPCAFEETTPEVMSFPALLNVLTLDVCGLWNLLKISVFGFFYKKTNQTEPILNFENQKLGLCSLVFKKPNRRFLDIFYTYHVS